MRPSVLVASAYFPPHSGGVERYTQGIVHEFNRRGWDCDVVTSAIGQPDRPTPTTPGPGRLRVAFWDVFEAMGRLPVVLPTLHNRRLMRATSASRYDLAIIQSHLYVGHALLADRLAGRTPTVLIGHGSGVVPTGVPGMDLALHQYERSLACAMRSRVTATLGVSQAAARWMETLGFSEVAAIGNATEIGSDSSVAASHTGPLRLVYVGRMEPGKGADRAIRAAIMAQDRLPSGSRVQLTLAGSGSQSRGVEKLADGHPDVVTYVGSLDHKEVEALLAESEVFIYPSTYPEGFPTVLLEAAAAGCALLTYPIAGSEELLGGTNAGWIVRNEAEAAEVLRRVCLNRTEARDSGINASQLVRREFTWPRVVDRVLENAQ